MKTYLFLLLACLAFSCEREHETEEPEPMICWKCEHVWNNSIVEYNTYCKAEQLYGLGRTGIITEEIIRLYERTQSIEPDVFRVSCKKVE